MRKFFKMMIVAGVLSSTTIAAIAQENENGQSTKAKWISDKGFWVVESNIKTPQTSTVYFYNNQNDLLYKEQLDGVKLNIKKRRTLMMLKQVLDKSLLQTDVAKKERQDQQLVKNTLKYRN
jgi:hypothetical protein